MSDYTVTSLSLNAGSAAITKQSAQANADIDTSGVRADSLLIELSNTDAATARFTFGTGANGILADIGTLVVDVAQNETKIVGPLESARFTLSTGKINVLCTATGGGAYGGTLSNVKLLPFVVPFN